MIDYPNIPSPVPVEEADAIYNKSIKKRWYNKLFKKRPALYWVFLKEIDGMCFEKFGVLDRSQGRDFYDWSTLASKGRRDPLRGVWGPYFDRGSVFKARKWIEEESNRSTMHNWMNG